METVGIKLELEGTQEYIAGAKAVEGLSQALNRVVTTAGAAGRHDAARMSMFGMQLANAAQDAVYNPMYAVNNMMFMAQMSGGVKALGEDLKQFAGVAVTAVTAGFQSIPAAIAGASAAMVGGGVALAALGGAALIVGEGLHDAGLEWSDFIDVMANTTPVEKAGEALAALGAILSATGIGGALANVKSDIAVTINELADYTLGWNAATEAVKKHKDEVAAIKGNTDQAIRTSGFIRKDFGKDLDKVKTQEELADVSNRINKAYADSRMSEEDYAAVLEQTSKIKDQLAEQTERAENERVKAAGKAAFDLAAAETDLVAERIRLAEATEKTAQASRNAAEAAGLEAEQKAKLGEYDRRVSKRVDAYGQVFGGGLAQAQYAAAARGEDQETTDKRLRGQLAARMQNVPAGMRDTVIDQMLARSRGMAEDYAVNMGVRQDVVGSQLAGMAGGDQRTMGGVMARQQAARMAQAAGIDLNAYGGKSVGDKQIESATKTDKAADKFLRAAELIERVQVTI
jgi:hypothetical protein